MDDKKESKGADRLWEALADNMWYIIIFGGLILYMLVDRMTEG